MVTEYINPLVGGAIAIKLLETGSNIMKKKKGKSKVHKIKKIKPIKKFKQLKY